MDTTKLLIIAWKKLPPLKEHPNDRIKISISLNEVENQKEVTRSNNPDNAGLGDSSHQIEFYKKEQNGEIIWEVGNIT